MKNSKLVLFLVTPLLIGGCQTTPKKKTSKHASSNEQSSLIDSTSTINTSQGGTSSYPVTSSGAPLTSAQPIISSTTPTTKTSSTYPQSSQSPITSSGSTPVPEEIIEGVFIRDPSIEAKVGVRTKTPLVDVYYTEGHSSEEFDNPLTWDTSDHDIAITDEYGRVTASKKGIVTLTCRSVVDNKSASVKVYCYNSESDFEKSWKKMESSDILAPGDQLIIACPEYNKAATEDCSGMMLHSCDVTFNADKSVITDINLAAKFVLGTDYKGRDGYNLEIPEREDGRYLACTNEKKVSFFDTPKASSNLWEIEYNFEQSCWDMRSATTIDGWMMYNRDLDRFAPYQSSQTEFMIVMSLYRLTRTFK